MPKTTSRALSWCRARGWEVGIVERRIQIPGKRFGGRNIDLFGIADILAIEPGVDGVNFVQTCASGRMQDHLRTIAGIDTSKLILRCGNRITILGWRKVKARRGGVKVLWKARIVEALLDEDSMIFFSERKTLAGGTSVKEYRF